MSKTNKRCTHSPSPDRHRQNITNWSLALRYNKCPLSGHWNRLVNCPLAPIGYSLQLFPERPMNSLVSGFHRYVFRSSIFSCSVLLGIGLGFHFSKLKSSCSRGWCSTRPSCSTSRASASSWQCLCNDPARYDKEQIMIKTKLFMSSDKSQNSTITKILTPHINNTEHWKESKYGEILHSTMCSNNIKGCKKIQISIYQSITICCLEYCADFWKCM